MSEQKLREELHTPKVPENEGEVFSLEDILREFGAPQAPEKKAVPQEKTSEPPQKINSDPSLQAQPAPTEEKQKKARDHDASKVKPQQKKQVSSVESQLKASQSGMAGRRVRLVLSFLLSAGAAVLTCMRHWVFPADYAHYGLLNLAELGILIVCALLTMDVLFLGKGSAAKQGAGFRLLIAFELISAVVYGFLSLSVPEPGFSAQVALILSFGLLSAQLRCRGMRDTMEAAQGCKEGNTLFHEAAFYGKLPGMIPGKGSVESFLQENEVKPAPQRTMDFYGIFVIGISVVGAVIIPWASIRELLGNALLLSTAGTPLCAVLVWSRPWSILASRLGQKGAALYGWRGVKWASKKTAVPVSDSDLFPPDNMKLNGVKFFGGADPDCVIAYGASVMNLAGGGLKGIFARQAELRGLKSHDVSRFRRYDSGGVSGEIGEDSVLVGTLRFMQSMGVGMPAGTKVSQAVYVAINGDLAGVFAINYGISRSIAETMAMLTSSGKSIPVITAGDFIITEAFLRSKFRINTEKMQFPSLSSRAEMERKEPTDAGKPCVLYRGGRFQVMALATCGSGALMAASLWGAVLAILGGVLGMAAVFAVLVHPGVVLPGVGVLLYQLLWAVPGWILSGWTKNV